MIPAEPIEARYAKAVEREQFIRDYAYTGGCEKIGSFKVNPLTPRHVIALRAIGSPFICGGSPTVEDATSFLLEIWPVAITPEVKQALEKECRRLWRGKPVNFYETVIQIQQFVNEAYMDAPPGSGRVGKIYFSEASGLCDRFGIEYGWHNDQTLDTPYKQLFQQMKLMRARDRAKLNKPAALSNPLSDAIINEMLEEENEQLRKEHQHKESKQ